MIDHDHISKKEGMTKAEAYENMKQNKFFIAVVFAALLLFGSGATNVMAQEEVSEPAVMAEVGGSTESANAGLDITSRVTELALEYGQEKYMVFVNDEPNNLKALHDWMVAHKLIKANDHASFAKFKDMNGITPAYERLFGKLYAGARVSVLETQKNTAAAWYHIEQEEWNWAWHYYNIALGWESGIEYLLHPTEGVLSTEMYAWKSALK